MPKRYTIPDDEITHYNPPEFAAFSDEELRPLTVDEIQALQKQAYEEGRQQGYEKGHEQGLQDGLREMTQKAQQLQSNINFLQQPLEDLDAEVEDQLTQLCLILTRLLLKKECSLDAEHIQNLVHESLDYLPVKARNVRVRLNPADIALMEQAQIKLDEQSWHTISDSSVRSGGCIIESDTSHIDASVETRLQQLVDQLAQHQSGDYPATDPVEGSASTQSPAAVTQEPATQEQIPGHSEAQASPTEQRDDTSE